MLRHPTLDQLSELKLHGMVRALEEQLQMEDLDELSFEERLGFLVEREATERASRRFESRLRRAKLRELATIEDLDLRTRRGLDRKQILRLASCQWIADHLNTLIVGPTDQVTLCTTSPKPGIMGVSPVSLSQRGPFARELAISRASCTASVCRAAA